MSKKKTHEEYVAELAKINPNVEVLGTYVNCKTKILHKCKIDDYKWEIRPDSLFGGQGCPKCANVKKSKTHEQYVVDLAKINPNIKVIDTYINKKIKLKHKCLIDGHEWEVAPHSILTHKTGCPKCNTKKPKTHEEYVNQITKINPNIEVLETYINNITPITHRCINCKHKMYKQPCYMIQKCYCPVCEGKGRVIGPPPQYKNSIWDSEYKEHFSIYLTEEQMKKYTLHNDETIKVSCPYCGNIKETKIRYLFERGLPCVCSDSVSYPNKFIYEFLNQLNITYIKEFSPDWNKNARYDIYIPSLSCIIENHGSQHYEECSLISRTLKDEQINDSIKKEKAYKNHIKFYVELDCRKSEISWIKNSIMHSELPILLHFQEDTISWIDCHKHALKNIIKDVADAWNNGLKVSEISKLLHIGYTTTIKYLKQSAIAGWTNYNKINSMKRKEKNRWVKVCQFSMDNQLINTYHSIAEAGKTIGVHYSNISKCCRNKTSTSGGFKWMYYNEYLAQQNNSNNNK